MGKSLWAKRRVQLPQEADLMCVRMLHVYVWVCVVRVHACICLCVCVCMCVCVCHIQRRYQRWSVSCEGSTSQASTDPVPA